MNQVHRYEPHRFRSAVPFYERYRLAYPQKLIGRVIALAGLAPGDAVLDLGSGPGLLAVPFALAGMAVTAVDPEPAMLEAAEMAAHKAGVALSLWQGGSYDLTPAMGPYRLVAIGRAFHWMDRAATLEMLDRIVAPGGVVVFFHDAHPDVSENRWFKTLREVTDRHSKEGRHSKDGSHVAERHLAERHLAERKAGGHRRYEPYLFASAFTELEGASVTTRGEITLDDIIGRAYSMSTCAPDRLGDRRSAFESDLRAAMAPLAKHGKFIEIAEMVALVARRPGQA